jgi:hypothetical protein
MIHKEGRRRRRPCPVWYFLLPEVAHPLTKTPGKPNDLAGNIRHGDERTGQFLQ